MTDVIVLASHEAADGATDEELLIAAYEICAAYNNIPDANVSICRYDRNNILEGLATIFGTIKPHTYLGYARETNETHLNSLLLEIVRRIQGELQIPEVLYGIG
jgi:hypothetical protein